MDTVKRASTAAHLARLGIDGATFAPPPYRVAWWLGLDIAPPLFTRFVWCAIAQSIFYALAIGVALGVVDVLGYRVGTLPVVVFGSIVCGVALGVIDAIRYRYLRKQLRLPTWERYEPPLAA